MFQPSIPVPRLNSKVIPPFAKCVDVRNFFTMYETEGQGKVMAHSMITIDFPVQHVLRKRFTQTHISINGGTPGNVLGVYLYQAHYMAIYGRRLRVGDHLSLVSSINL